MLTITGQVIFKCKDILDILLVLVSMFCFIILAYWNSIHLMCGQCGQCGSNQASEPRDFITIILMLI